MDELRNNTRQILDSEVKTLVEPVETLVEQVETLVEPVETLVEQVETLVEQVEEGIYDYAIERLDNLGYAGQDDLPIDKLMFLYNQIFAKVMITKNDELIKKDPYNFCRMTREELKPEKWDLLYKNRTEDIVKKKGAHRCPKCKSWFTEYIEVQTRAADEAATIKISCECGYRWKLN